MTDTNQPPDSLTVAVLGTGRMAGIHLAALAELRDHGLRVDGKSVRVEPAVYGRDPAKVRAVAEQHGLRRTSTRLEELIDARDIARSAGVHHGVVQNMRFNPGPRKAQVDLELRDPFGLQLEQFLAGIVRGQPTAPDWSDAVTNQRLIKAAYRSMTERREVQLAEIASQVAAVA